MRSSVVLLFCFIVFNPEIYAAGYCDASQSRKSAWKILDKQYIKILDRLKEIKDEYNTTLTHLKDNNDKFEREIRLLKDNLLKEKEIVFKLRQFNELKGIESSILTTGE